MTLITVLLIMALYSIYITGRMFESTAQGRFYRFVSGYKRGPKLSFRDLSTILANYEKEGAIEVHDVDYCESLMRVRITYKPVYLPVTIVRDFNFKLEPDQ